MVATIQETGGQDASCSSLPSEWRQESMQLFRHLAFAHLPPQIAQWDFAGAHPEVNQSLMMWFSWTHKTTANIMTCTIVKPFYVCVFELAMEVVLWVL